MRAEFSKKTRLAAWQRCGGICECGCNQKIITPEYHHAVPAALGGSNELDNCRVLNKRCHRVLTETHDVPEIKRSTRIFEKRINARNMSRPMAGSRASGFKKRMDGTVERRR